MHENKEALWEGDTLLPSNVGTVGQRLPQSQFPFQPLFPHCIALWKWEVLLKGRTLHLCSGQILVPGVSPEVFRGGVG